MSVKSHGSDEMPNSDDRTDPGGPSPLLMEEARREAQGPPQQAHDASGLPLDAQVTGMMQAVTRPPAPRTAAPSPAPSPASSDEQTRLPGPGDATLIYDKNRRPIEKARLLVVAGPRAGAEFTLTEVETSIGRGSDNTLIIPDISVSRHHVVIRREADRYLLTDLGSGNGSRVNDLLVERHMLQSGDEIALGDTQMRFLEPGGVAVKHRSGRFSAPPPAGAEAPALDDDTHGHHRAGSGLKARAPIYLVIGVLLLVLFGALALYRRQREQAEADAAHAREEGQAFAQQQFDEGVKLFKEGRWIAARDKLKVAAELAPQDGEKTQRYLRAEAEVPRAQALDQAKAALLRRDYAGAREQLREIPDDSALAEPARDLGRQIRAALESAVREARIKAENGDSAAARALIDAVLAAEPERADALAIRAAAGPSRRGQRGGPQAGPGPARAAQSRPPPVAEAAPASEAAKAIVEAYLAGDIGTAEELADGASDPRSQHLARDLKSFDASYRDGLAKIQARRLGDAIRALDQADKIDRALAQGHDSRLGKEVRRALGNLHYNFAVQAMGQEEALGVAATHLRAATAADPDNEAARKQLGDLVERARELYQRAYFEKDSEPESARKLFRVVAEALPPGDEMALKARRWADKLEGKGGAE
jgi:pSer/pThr/pTyr-binding forkhead associated (FHA) protein